MQSNLKSDFIIRFRNENLQIILIVLARLNVVMAIKNTFVTKGLNSFCLIYTIFFNTLMPIALLEKNFRNRSHFICLVTCMSWR